MLYLVLTWLISDALSVAIVAACSWPEFLEDISRLWRTVPNVVLSSSIPFWLTVLAAGPIGTVMLVARLLIPFLLS